MGVVYKAEQDHPRRSVALKVIRPGIVSLEVLRRFDQEAQALGRLQHPGIAQIYEAGTEDTGAGQQPYFAMEFVAGQNLQVFASARNFNLRQRLELMAKVCDAVHHAHQRGIIHRDLKPSNILVDETGQPKIVDFGVARVTDSDAKATRQTDIGQLMGTLPYMSPEQVLADPLELDTRSDIYTLGVILYEFLGGALPYNIGRTTLLHEAVRIIREEEPVPLSSVNRSCRGDVQTIVNKALEKDKARRYASAAGFAADIRRFLNDEPIIARPPSASYQLQKFARRNRVLVGGAAMVLVALIAGIVATARQARIAQGRFEDVRSLATSFLFDFDAALAHGVTPARKLVVAKGLEYLDKLSRENPKDERLQAEVADAYERLAEIQGNPLGSSLGEYSNASASYQKGMAIREKLATLNPRDLAMRRQLANSYIRFADTGLSGGDLKTAVEYYHKGLSTLGGLTDSATEGQSARSIAQRGHTRLCALLLPTDHAAAIQNCRAAIDDGRRIVQDRPSDPAARAKLALAYGVTGNALRIDRKTEEATSFLDLAIREYEDLTAKDPNNVDWMQTLAACYTYRAACWAARPDLDHAVQDNQSAVKVIGRAVEADPKNVRSKVTQGTALMRFAKVLQQVRKPAEAHTAAAQALECFRDLADRPEASPDDANTYANFLLDPTAGDLRDPRKALVYSKRAVAASSQPSLVFLSTLVDAYAECGDLPNAISVAERALKLNAAPAGGSSSALRSELEQKLAKFRAPASRPVSH